MKPGLQSILGKRIAGVIVAENENHAPRNQVFLVFTDGTRFELYGDSFTCCSGVDKAADIERYVQSAGGEIVSVYVPPQPEPPKMLMTGRESAEYHANHPETLLELMSRDLEAWRAAKGVIEKAKDL